jgi:hypothetical protein
LKEFGIGGKIEGVKDCCVPAGTRVSSQVKPPPVARGNLERGGAAMKKLQSLLIPIAALLMFLALAATEASAQNLSSYSTQYTGTLTLTFAAQWGKMVLPPGEYNINYGTLTSAGLHVVEVASTRDPSVRGWALPKAKGDIKGTKSRLVCIREGNKGYVRSLELPEIGATLYFPRPHGVSVKAWIVSEKQSHNATTQLAEMRISLAPVPVI